MLLLGVSSNLSKELRTPVLGLTEVHALLASYMPLAIVVINLNFHFRLTYTMQHFSYTTI